MVEARPRGFGDETRHHGSKQLIDTLDVLVLHRLSWRRSAQFMPLRGPRQNPAAEANDPRVTCCLQRRYQRGAALAA
jgi:hypothetical protein